jgi:hypothetical protein
MKVAAGVIIVGPSHFDFLEAFFKVFNQALDEYLKSVGFSKIKPGSVRCAHGDGFHGCWPPDVFGVCSKEERD